jgi:hypothetical protein
MKLNTPSLLKSAAYGLGLMVMAVSTTSATTLLTPNTPATADPLGPNSIYNTGTVFLGNGVPVSEAYYFTIPSALFTITTAITFNTDAGNGIGISNATAEWFSSTSLSGPFIAASPVLQVSDINGVETTGQPRLSLGLGGAVVYELLFQGTTLANGGNFDLSVQGTPLPAAALLFGSVLAGAGLIARRRRARALNGQAA